MADSSEFITCENSIIFDVANSNGLIWSPKAGMIQFQADQVKKIQSDNPVEDFLIPGVAVSVSARKLFPQEELEAIRVTIKKFPADYVIDAFGTITKIRERHAALDSDSLSDSLHVPISAVDNGITGNYQFPELEGRKVHFLAIPNPEPHKFDSYYVLALHPCSKSCQDEGIAARHWLLTSHTDPQEVEGYRLLKNQVEETASPSSPKIQGFKIGVEEPSDAVQSRDGVLLWVNDSCGVIWSPDYGKIDFKFGDIDGWSHTDRISLFPGMTVDVVADRYSTGLRATSLVSMGYMSSFVRESLGQFRCFGDKGGILPETMKERILTVPPEAYGKETKEDLEKCQVHFLAIHPSEQLGTNCTRQEEEQPTVIALHSACRNCRDDAENRHWVNHWSREPDATLASTVSFRVGIRPKESTESTKRCWDSSRVFEDCYFTYIRCSQGYLRSAENGVICFDTRCLLGISPRDIIPGTLARKVVAVPFRQDANPTWRNVHNPKWKAVSVEVGEERRRSPDVYSGRGIVTEEKHTFGFLKNLRNKAKMFVPGWAGVNNLGDGSIGWQIAQLAEGEVHFLAMPNPKPKHQGEPFVIAAHPYSEICSAASGNRGRHWIFPQENSSQGKSADQLSSARMNDRSGGGRGPVTQEGMNTCPIQEELRKAMRSISDDRLSQLAMKCPLAFEWAFSSQSSLSPEIEEEIDVLKSLNIL